LFEVARQKIRTRHLAFRTEQDLVLDRGELIVRDAKGGKDPAASPAIP
jgi:hypothetical protein